MGGGLSIAGGPNFNSTQHPSNIPQNYGVATLAPAPVAVHGLHHHVPYHIPEPNQTYYPSYHPVGPNYIPPYTSLQPIPPSYLQTPVMIPSAPSPLPVPIETFHSGNSAIDNNQRPYNFNSSGEPAKDVPQNDTNQYHHIQSPPFHSIKNPLQLGQKEPEAAVHSVITGTTPVPSLITDGQTPDITNQSQAIEPQRTSPRSSHGYNSPSIFSPPPSSLVQTSSDVSTSDPLPHITCPISSLGAAPEDVFSTRTTENLVEPTPITNFPQQYVQLLSANFGDSSAPETSARTLPVMLSPTLQTGKFLF